MAKFDDKVNGNTVDADEYNNIVRAAKNAITDSGQTIDTSNTQLSKALANYAAVSTFYTDSGAADAYVLTPITTFKPPSAYINGMEIRFRAGNAGTGGAATVNVAGLGVKSLKEADGSTNPSSIPTTEDSMYRYDGTVFRKVNLVVAATQSVAGISLLPKQITIENGTDTDHDLNFTAGNAQADDGSLVFSVGALTKQIDAAWAAGTNQGGLDTGTVANNTPYYLYAIYNPTSGVSDILFTATKGSPTMPSGYTKKYYIGACHTNGSANIRNGTWSYDSKGSIYKFDLKDFIQEFNDINPGTSAVLKTITAPANSFVFGKIGMFDDSAATPPPILLVTATNQTDRVPSGSDCTLNMVQISATGENNYEQSYGEFLLDSSSQLRYRLSKSDADINVQFINYGWKELL